MGKLKQHFVTDEQWNLGLKKDIIIIGDHLSGTLKKQTDFQLCEGLNRVETKPSNFSKNLSLEGNPRSGTLYS